MPFCTNCGNQLIQGTKFCPNCGAAVNGANANFPHQQQEPPKIMNCPCCGAMVSSFKAKCPICGVEINNIHKTACQNLCERLDNIEACRPKENLTSWVTGMVNNLLDNHRMSPTDQQKVELINNFIVPNTKSDILEFIFLAQAKIKICKESSGDGYTSYVQGELRKAWRTKLDHTMEKAHMVLAGDPDFLAVEKDYQKQKYKDKGLCPYCGGKYKGFFTKTCIKCGKVKDYEEDYEEAEDEEDED